MSIEVKPTDRGFLLGEFTDSHGKKCSIQESSIAEYDAIWLGINDPDPKLFIGNGIGWKDYKLPENVHCITRMHLTKEQVIALLPLLTKFVETGGLNLG